LRSHRTLGPNGGWIASGYSRRRLPHSGSAARSTKTLRNRRGDARGVLALDGLVVIDPKLPPSNA
jgi:hypothetical protein